MGLFGPRASSKSRLRGAARGVPLGVNVLDHSRLADPAEDAARRNEILAPKMLRDLADRSGLVPDKNIDHGPVTVDFSADDTTVLEDAVVTFTSVVTGPQDTYLWDFGDDVTSTAKHPTHAYADAGSYDVSLTVTNTAGDLFVTEKAAYIVVSAP